MEDLLDSVAERPVQYSFSAACASLQRLAVVIASPFDDELHKNAKVSSAFVASIRFYGLRRIFSTERRSSGCA